MVRMAALLLTLHLLTRILSGADAPSKAAPGLGEPALPVRGWIDDFSYGGLEFSSDSQHLLIDNGHKARIYDIATLKPTCDPFPTDWNAQESSYTADGSLIFATGDIGPAPQRQRAQYFDALTGKPASPPFTCDGEYGESFTSSDGKHLCQQYRDFNGDHVIRVIERSTSRVEYSNSSGDIEYELGLNADGSVLAYVDFGEQYGPEPAWHLIRVRDGKKLLVGELESDVRPRCRLSPDGKSVCLIGGPSGLRIFDLATEKMTTEIPAREWAKRTGDDLGYPEFSTDGKDVLFGRKGGQLRWSIARGIVTPVAVKQEEAHVVEVACRDGRRAMCRYGSDPYNGGVTGTDIVDVASGKPIWKYAFDAVARTPRLALSGDGRRIAISFAEKNRTFLLDLNDVGAAAAATEIPAPSIPIRIGEPAFQVRARIDSGSHFDQFGFSPDGKTIFVTNNQKNALWDASLSTEKPLPPPVEQAAWNVWKGNFVTGGSMLFCEYNDYERGKQKLKAQSFDAISGKPVGPGFAAKGTGSIVCSADGRYLAATYGEDGPFGFPPTTELKVIERATSKVIFSRTYEGGILAFMPHLSRDGRFAIYEEFSGKAVMRVLRVSDGKFLFEGELKARTVAFSDAVNFSPDGKSIVIGEENSFKIFDLDTQNEIYVSPDFKPSDDDWKALPLREASFSDDGSCVIYRQESDFRRWSVAEKRFLPAFLWKGPLDKISLSRDARRMACSFQTNDVAPDEGTAIFDLDTGKYLWKWSRFRNWGDAVLSPDGKRALVSDSIHESIYAIDLPE